MVVSTIDLNRQCFVGKPILLLHTSPATFRHNRCGCDDSDADLCFAGAIFGQGCSLIAVICVTKNRTGDYDFRACARARGFRGSTFSAGRICFAVCAERSRDKTCVF